MGSPVSPIVANLFMEDFEEKALASYPKPPRYWGRYVDDTMTIILRTEVEPFTQYLNQLHPAIKFIIETENNNAIPMLDTLITRNADGSLPIQCISQANTHWPIPTIQQPPASIAQTWRSENLDPQGWYHLLHQGRKGKRKRTSKEGSKHFRLSQMGVDQAKITKEGHTA